jgi:hypothetical protein
VTIISSLVWSSFQQRWFPEEEELGIILETLKLASRSFLLSLSRDSFFLSLSLSLSRALLLFLEVFYFLGVLGLVMRLSQVLILLGRRITSSWKP